MVDSPGLSLAWAVRQWVLPSAARSSSIRMPSSISCCSGFRTASSRNPCEFQFQAWPLGAARFTFGHSAGWKVTRTAPGVPEMRSTLAEWAASDRRSRRRGPDLGTRRFGPPDRGSQQRPGRGRDEKLATHGQFLSVQTRGHGERVTLGVTNGQRTEARLTACAEVGKTRGFDRQS